MKLFKYKNYEDYKKNQIEANIRKINNSYVDPNSLHSLLNYLVEDLKINPKLILCHGTRRGLEQQYIIDFLKPLGHAPKVIGTEISPTALNYPNTIQWDFHEVKPEWVNNTDIIYSNSFDHSCKPQECLDIWMSCLNKKGVCVLEYSPDCDNKSQAADPFGATLDEYKNFIEEKYKIVDTLVNDGIKDEGITHKGIRYFIIIKNKDE
tara:strand:- start:6678 stop:7298 length:621 start_codon:yes stop_codon:yes gene_type:complete